jgi:transposase
MWTQDARAEHDRDDLRCLSDLTEPEWRVLALLLPPPVRVGRHRSRPMRETIDALVFVLRGGGAWRMLPRRVPPHQTVYRRFTRFRGGGASERLNRNLVMLNRERVAKATTIVDEIVRTVLAPWRCPRASRCARS